jgi:hypothetical protein
VSSADRTRASDPRAVPRALVIALALALILAPMASAQPTREAYVAQVEPICKANTDANTKILGGARNKVKKGKYRAASRQFSKAARAFSRTVGQLTAVEQPPSDAATLARWLEFLRAEARYLAKVAKELRAENLNKAQGYVIRLSRNANRANDTVAGMGFNECLINPSKFA